MKLAKRISSVKDAKLSLVKHSVRIKMISSIYLILLMLMVVQGAINRNLELRSLAKQLPKAGKLVIL